MFGISSSLLPSKTGLTLYLFDHIVTFKIFGWEIYMKCLHIFV